MDEVDFWSELSSRGGATSKVAQQVHLFLEPLRPALEGLMEGDVEGSWEGIKEVVEQLLQALRQVGRQEGEQMEGDEAG